MNALRYILPIAIVLLALLFFRSRRQQTTEDVPPPRPAIVAEENRAEGERILSGLEAIYAQATTILASVKDGASAEAAVSQLEALGPQIDKAVATWNQVPESFRPKFRPLAASGYEKLKSAIDQALSLPGVSEKLKPTTDQLLAKLKAFA